MKLIIFVQLLSLPFLGGLAVKLFQGQTSYLGGFICGGILAICLMVNDEMRNL